MSSKVINLTSDAIKKSGKRAKSASPTGKSNAANTSTSTSTSTSIIDNILKERAASTGTNSPGKKLIIDLAKDNFILTDAKPLASNNLAKPQPIRPLVSKPIDPVIINIDPAQFVYNKSKSKSTSKSKQNSLDNEDFGNAPMNIDDIDDVSAASGLPTWKSGAHGSPAGSLGNSVVSRAKMDKMKTLDAVFLSSTPSPIPASPILGYQQQKPRPKTTDPLDFIFDNTPISQPTRSSSPPQILTLYKSQPKYPIKYYPS